MQISWDIIDGENAIIQKEVQFFKDTRYASIFLDESTTTGMKICPAYCGVIGITNTFQWMMCFIGQTNAGECESGEVYFNKIKHVFSEYELKLMNAQQ